MLTTLGQGKKKQQTLELIFISKMWSLRAPHNCIKLGHQKLLH